jgi:outer membrane protein TolC
MAIGVFAPSAALSATALTVADVRQRALESNRTYLSAKEDVVKAQSQITTARSGALPDITLTGSYSRNLKLPSFFVQPDSGQAIEFRTGFNNDFSATLSVQQSLWEGGKVFTALSIAKLYKKYSLAKEAEVRSTVIVNAEQLFFAAILQQSNLLALQKAFEANSLNLDMVEKQYSQGVVSEFEVLRARVEKQNLMPQIFKAESDVKLARKKLQTYIGMELSEDVTLIEELGDTTLTALPSMQELVDTALEQRPEIQQLDYLTLITKKAVKVARGDYYPKLKAVSSYNWSAQSDRLTLSEHNTKSWQAGLNLTIPIFKGGATRGSVTNSLADYRQTMLSSRQTRDNIRLEVEEAYDQLIQAKKSLEVQGTTIAQAEEGLRIANVRYQSGVGTLLEVLSAQSALTQARNSLALATYSFQVAKSQLRKATTIDIN